MGTAATTGWIIAGALVFAVAVWMIVMAREVRNAIDLTEHFESEESKASAAKRYFHYKLSRTGRRMTPAEKSAMSGKKIRGLARRTISLPRKPMTDV